MQHLHRWRVHGCVSASLRSLLTVFELMKYSRMWKEEEMRCKEVRSFIHTGGGAVPTCESELDLAPSTECRREQWTLRPHSFSSHASLLSSQMFRSMRRRCA